jgi:alpha/beta superfamily hydrolase
VQKLVDRLSAQRGIRISYRKIDGANHFFDNHMPEVIDIVAEYVKNRMESPYGGR